LTRAFLIFLIITSLSAAAWSQSRALTTRPAVGAAEREVRNAVANWARAVRNRDIESLERIFADDLFIADYSGGTRNKQQELEILKPSPTTRTISVTNESLRVKMFPRSNSAVVWAVVRMVFRANGRDSNFAMRYMSLWEKRAGRWQLTVLQTTRLPAR